MNQAGRITGKVAIVTGAGTGLGRRPPGCSSGRAPTWWRSDGGRKLKEIADELAADGGPGRVAVVAGDVAGQDTAEAACRWAGEEFGGLDIVVNNAGIHSRRFLVHETPVAEFEEFLAVDLLRAVPVHAGRDSLPAPAGRWRDRQHLLHGRLRRVQVLGLVLGREGGLISLTRATAADYGDAGIRANCLCLGGMEPVERGNLAPDDYVRLHEAVAAAGGTLIKRVAHVDEVAELVLFLSGSQSKSLTGAVIPFDAGFTAY